MKGFLRALGSFRYMSLLQYLPFLEELRQSLIRTWGDWEILSRNLADIFFRAVDLATGGLASRVVNQERINRAVTDVSRAVVSLMAVIADIRNGTEPLSEEPFSRV